jgi:hypothetical protein
MDQIISMTSDILLGAGALGAALYCVVLARRLKRFNNLENGVGGAVAVLSAQVDDMTRTLDLARKAAAQSSDTLTALTERAEDSARKLELMMAALHDLPDPAEAPAPAPVPQPATRELQDDAAWEAEAARAAEEKEEIRFTTTRVQLREVVG